MNASRLALALTLPIAVLACSSSSSPATTGGATNDGNTGSDAGSSSASDSGSSGTSNPGSPSNPGNPSGSSDASTSDDAGPSSTSDGGGVVSATDATLVLNIPANFTGTTRELDVVVTPTVPIAGPPAGILLQMKNPTITAGHAVTVHGDTTGVTGKYYVVVVLYMQGGGTFSPKVGTDYEAQTMAPITFDAKAIDLGTLSLALASSDGGT